MIKVCTKCRKKYSEPFEKWFNKNRSTKDGLCWECKKCRKKYRKKTKHIIKKYNRVRYRTHNGFNYSQKNRWKRYGITPDDYNRMFGEQNGVCAICGTHQSELNRSLDVDHDHKTGKVRGLLCRNCNIGLGNFQDSKDLLLRTIEYLK